MLRMTGIPVNKKRLHLDFDPDYQDGREIVDKRRCIDDESVPSIHAPWLHRLDVVLEHKQREALHLQEMSHICRRTLHLVRMGAARLFFAAMVQQGRAGWLWPSEAPHGTGLHPAISQLLNTPMKNTPSFLMRKSRRKVTTLASQDTIIVSDRDRQYLETHVEDVKPASDEGELVVMKDEMTDSTRYEASNPMNDETSYAAKNETSESIKNETFDSLKDNALGSAKSEALTKIPRYVPPFMPDPPTVCAASVRMERHRIKRRIVVGNISKWLPEEFRLDAASHKWMLYVRGPRDAPDVSDIISKVRYFLHPSYQPNDIVDVVHPFYLNRRGWGEFPVRVQVHFSLPGNRPIDIIHNLKLDRTYSGLQTLGSETVVEVWLKTPLAGDINHFSEDEKNKEVKSVASLKPGNIVFNDGEHLTLDHKASDEVVQCMLPKQVIKEEVPERLQDEKNSSCSTKEIVFHSIPDHDYLGLGSFKTGCTACASDHTRENGRGFLAIEDYVFDGAREGIKRNEVIERKVCPYQPMKSECIPTGNSEEYCEQTNSKDLISDALSKKNGVSRAYVQCVDDKGNVLLVSLEKPDLATKNVQGKDTIASTSEKSSELPSSSAGCSLYGDTLEDSGGSWKVLTSGSFVGRSVLKKNVFSSRVKVVPGCLSAPKSVGLPIGTSEPVLSLSQTTSCKMEMSMEQSLRKDAGALLSQLEERAAATWVLRRLPLALARADPDSTFRRCYPFCTQSSTALVTWPLGRRLHVQWVRAKTVLDVLREEAAEPFARWSVRHLQAWARSHGLEPALPSRQRPPPPSPHPEIAALDALHGTLTEPTETRDWLERAADASRAAQELEDVEVECDLERPRVVDFMVSTRQEENGIVLPIGTGFLDDDDDDDEYLRNTIHSVGFRLTVEPLCPGYLYPSAECLILSACRFLCEDILRRSLHQASNHCEEVASEISAADVKDALLTRREFDIFTNVGLGVRNL